MADAFPTPGISELRCYGCRRAYSPTHLRRLSGIAPGRKVGYCSSCLASWIRRAIAEGRKDLGPYWEAYAELVLVGLDPLIEPYPAGDRVAREYALRALAQPELRNAIVSIAAGAIKRRTKP